MDEMTSQFNPGNWGDRILELVLPRYGLFDEMDKLIKERIEELKFKFKNCYLRHALKDIEIVEECSRVLEQYPWFETIENVITGAVYGVEEPPKCLYCGKELTNHYGVIHGRIKSCCIQHGAFIGEEKKKKTCLERFGTTTPLTNSEIKKKTEATCLKKFGKKTFAGSKEHYEKVVKNLNYDETIQKSLETKRKRYGDDFGKYLFEKNRKQIEENNLKKYGEKYPFLVKEYFEKSHETMLERYGRRYYGGIGNNHKAHLDKGFENVMSWGEYVKPLFTREEYQGYKQDVEYEWECVKCGLHFKSRIYSTGLGEGHVPRCPNCYRQGSSSIGEKELLYWIERNGISCISNSRSIIKPYELDIYIPEYNLAIEYNGIYWHKNHYENYHMNKFEMCRERGIRLLQFFDFEWDCKRLLVIQTVAFYLGLIEKERRKNIAVKNSTVEGALKFYAEHSFSDEVGDYNLAFMASKEVVAMISFNLNKASCEIVNFGFVSAFVRRNMLNYIVEKVFELSGAKVMRFSLDKRLYSTEEFEGFNVVGEIEPQEIEFKGDLSYDCGKVIIEREIGVASSFGNMIASLPTYSAYRQLKFF
jgi:hypothetical protein